MLVAPPSSRILPGHATSRVRVASCLACALVAFARISDASHVAWAESGPIDRIRVADENGENVVDVVLSPDVISSSWLTFDPDRQQIYWSDDEIGTIKRIYRDGTGIATVLAGLDSPQGLAFDTKGNALYWIENSHPTTSDRIRKYSFSSGTISDVITGIGRSSFGLALDPVDRMLYWTEAGSTDRVARVNVDGTHREDLVLGIDTPFGIALDSRDRRVFYTDHSGITCMDLDGSNRRRIVSEVDDYKGLAVDLEEDYLFMSIGQGIQPDGKLVRYKLDGTGGQIVYTSATGFVTGIVSLGAAFRPGDANGDGYITPADYTIWADNFGSGPGATILVGDFNLDGFVNGADYTVWADNYTGLPDGAIPAATAVPEPASALLMFCAAWGCAFVARSRRSSCV